MLPLRRRGAMRLRSLAATVLGCLLLAACGGSGASSEPSPSAGSVAGSWVLEAGTVDGNGMPILDDHRVTLVIEGSRIGGTAACNGYGGRVVTAPGGLRIDELGQTEMGCEEPAMALEAQFMNALGRVRQIVREGDELVIRGDDVELRFSGLPAVPTADLIETEWVLDMILTGDVAAAPLGKRATLQLDADGTFSGSTGCRTFSGEWTESGDQIMAPSFGMDQRECPAELSDQDGHVVSIIGDGFIPSVDGDLLTLMDPGGMGLVYRAGD